MDQAKCIIRVDLHLHVMQLSDPRRSRQHLRITCGPEQLACKEKEKEKGTREERKTLIGIALVA